MRKILVLIESSRAFGRGLLRGVGEYTRLHRSWTVCFEPHGLGDAPPPWLSTWAGDGILARIGSDDVARAIELTGKPAIDLRGILPHNSFPFVGSNHQAVGQLAAEHFLERGLKNFAFCGLPPGSRQYRDARREHFAARLRKKGFAVEICPDEVADLRNSWSQRQQYLAEWMAQLPKPIGLMACQDDSGAQVIDACRLAQVAVPDEVAVIGVDDDDLQCNFCSPPLTSIDLNAEKIGYEAAALLDGMMDGAPPPPAVTLFPPRGVVVRQSTEILAIDDPLVAEVLRYIRAHACEGLRVLDVVAATPLARGDLEHRFRELIGRSPKAEITRVQVERAKELLASTDLSHDLVARAAGFRDARYLCDVFSRKFGTTPGNYRKEHRPSGTPHEPRPLAAEPRSA